jgi:eukaryotic-like serine/threonine-protein kinase
MALAIGSRLGPYQIEALLGAGGMGEVYRARDTRLDRLVALKVLRPEIARDFHSRRRLEHEARAVSRLNHPHICVLYDIGREPGRPEADERDFLVMELVEGESLGHVMTK